MKTARDGDGRTALQQGLPNAEERRTTLRRALAAAGSDVQWTEWEVSSDAMPRHLRHYGSPTVLVDGHDVADAEPSDGACCRAYEIDGTRSGVPSSELIIRALVAAQHHKRPRGWRRALLVLPAIGATLVPGLTCPACWPGYAAPLSALGIGFIPTAPYLLPLTVGFLVVALAALAFQAETRTLLAVRVAASVTVLVGKFVLESNPVTYIGAAFLAAASLTITQTKNSLPCSACAPERSAAARAETTSSTEGR